MKLAKLMLTAVAVLGFCALNAQAQSLFVGTTTNYSSLSVSITVTTNTNEKVSGGVSENSVGSVKLGNKQLLDLFAVWNGISNRTNDTNWKNAQLEVGWDAPWNYDVIVVDKTGTNVLFDATSGVSGAYFELQFFNASGAYTWSEKNTTPGYEEWKENYTAYYNLFDDYVSGTYTDISGYGSNTESFKQDWNSEDVGTWTDSESVTIPNQGQGSESFRSIDQQTSAAVEIKATGKGKGYNYINDL